MVDLAAVLGLEVVGLEAVLGLVVVLGPEVVGLEVLVSFQVVGFGDLVASLVVYAMWFILACHVFAVAGCCKIVSADPVGPLVHLADRADLLFKLLKEKLLIYVRLYCRITFSSVLLIF